MQVIVSNFKIDAFRAGREPDRELGRLILASHGVRRAAPADCRIISKSVDSRGGRVDLVYSALLELDDATAQAGRFAPATAEEIARITPPEYLPPDSGLVNPIVVGTGPCGIFAALALALAGAKPVVLDRGRAVERRAADCEDFIRTRELDPESNLLIGEGGAGTFSDGKLYTGTRDGRAAFILSEFVRAGAPAEIRYLKRPHIGTDFLKKAAAGLRRRIIELGGEFRFGVEVTGVTASGGRCTGVVTASGERLEAPAVLIAPGLGGRDLADAIAASGVQSELKPFQIGCRIEHPQGLIDDRQYHLHGLDRPAALEAAEYHLSARPENGGRGVSSFCMCPGGEVVNATAWRGHSVTNGMSDHARAGAFANGCLIATLRPEEYGTLAEVRAMLDKLERQVFEQGGRDYSFPAQDAEAFLAGRRGLRDKRTACRWGISHGRVDELTPPPLREALSFALRRFDRVMPGFVKYGKIIGLESCVSSPLRFVRDETTLASSLGGLWLGGEGAGAAGGIMSAAADGLRLADAMLGASPK
ncbi:MAG: hypothetical protein PHI35_00505 [Victivallaceae bacterium]|nr:hypothetical protein [Victivallaceae bacterium]